MAESERLLHCDEKMDMPSEGGVGTYLYVNTGEPASANVKSIRRRGDTCIDTRTFFAPRFKRQPFRGPPVPSFGKRKARVRTLRDGSHVVVKPHGGEQHGGGHLANDPHHAHGDLNYPPQSSSSKTLRRKRRSNRQGSSGSDSDDFVSSESEDEDEKEKKNLDEAAVFMYSAEGQRVVIDDARVNLYVPNVCGLQQPRSLITSSTPAHALAKNAQRKLHDSEVGGNTNSTITITAATGAAVSTSSAAIGTKPPPSEVLKLKGRYAPSDGRSLWELLLNAGNAVKQAKVMGQLRIRAQQAQQQQSGRGSSQQLSGSTTRSTSAIGISLGTKTVNMRVLVHAANAALKNMPAGVALGAAATNASAVNTNGTAVVDLPFQPKLLALRRLHYLAQLDEDADKSNAKHKSPTSSDGENNGAAAVATTEFSTRYLTAPVPVRCPTSYQKRLLRYEILKLQMLSGIHENGILVDDSGGNRITVPLVPHFQFLYLQRKADRQREVREEIEKSIDEARELNRRALLGEVSAARVTQALVKLIPPHPSSLSHASTGGQSAKRLGSPSSEIRRLAAPMRYTFERRRKSYTDDNSPASEQKRAGGGGVKLASSQPVAQQHQASSAGGTSGSEAAMASFKASTDNVSKVVLPPIAGPRKTTQMTLEQQRLQSHEAQLSVVPPSALASSNAVVSDISAKTAPPIIFSNNGNRMPSSSSAATSTANATASPQHHQSHDEGVVPWSVSKLRAFMAVLSSSEVVAEIRSLFHDLTAKGPITPIIYAAFSKAFFMSVYVHLNPAEICDLVLLDMPLDFLGGQRMFDVVALTDVSPKPPPLLHIDRVPSETSLRTNTNANGTNGAGTNTAVDGNGKHGGDGGGENGGGTKKGARANANGSDVIGGVLPSRTLDDFGVGVVGAMKVANTAERIMASPSSQQHRQQHLVFGHETDLSPHAARVSTAAGGVHAFHSPDTTTNDNEKGVLSPSHLSRVMSGHLLNMLGGGAGGGGGGPTTRLHSPNDALVHAMNATVKGMVGSMAGGGQTSVRSVDFASFLELINTRPNTEHNTSLDVAEAHDTPTTGHVNHFANNSNHTMSTFDFFTDDSISAMLLGAVAHGGGDALTANERLLRMLGSIEHARMAGLVEGHGGGVGGRHGGRGRGGGMGNNLLAPSWPAMSGRGGAGGRRSHNSPSRLKIPTLSDEDEDEDGDLNLQKARRLRKFSEDTVGSDWTDTTATATSATNAGLRLRPGTREGIAELVRLSSEAYLLAARKANGGVDNPPPLMAQPLGFLHRQRAKSHDQRRGSRDLNSPLTSPTTLVVVKQTRLSGGDDSGSGINTPAGATSGIVGRMNGRRPQTSGSDAPSDVQSDTTAFSLPVLRLGSPAHRGQSPLSPSSGIGGGGSSDATGAASGDSERPSLSELTLGGEGGGGRDDGGRARPSQTRHSVIDTLRPAEVNSYNPPPEHRRSGSAGGRRGSLHQRQQLHLQQQQQQSLSHFSNANGNSSQPASPTSPSLPKAPTEAKGFDAAMRLLRAADSHPMSFTDFLHWLQVLTLSWCEKGTVAEALLFLTELRRFWEPLVDVLDIAYFPTMLTKKRDFLFAVQESVSKEEQLPPGPSRKGCVPQGYSHDWFSLQIPILSDFQIASDKRLLETAGKSIAVALNLRAEVATRQPTTDGGGEMGAQPTLAPLFMHASHRRLCGQLGGWDVAEKPYSNNPLIALLDHNITTVPKGLKRQRRRDRRARERQKKAEEEAKRRAAEEASSMTPRRRVSLTAGHLSPTSSPRRDLSHIDGKFSSPTPSAQAQSSADVKTNSVAPQNATSVKTPTKAKPPKPAEARRLHDDAEEEAIELSPPAQPPTLFAASSAVKALSISGAVGTSPSSCERVLPPIANSRFNVCQSSPNGEQPKGFNLGIGPAAPLVLPATQPTSSQTTTTTSTATPAASVTTTASESYKLQMIRDYETFQEKKTMHLASSSPTASSPLQRSRLLGTMGSSFEKRKLGN